MAGALLVEAVLATVVIATGLVFVSRGFSSHLKALRAVEDHEALLSLAQTRLLELEAERSTGNPLSWTPEGTFESPYDGYRWAIVALPKQGPEGMRYREVQVMVWREDHAASQLRLSAVWPAGWVPE